MERCLKCCCAILVLGLAIWASFKIGYKRGQREPITTQTDTITIVREKVAYRPKEIARIEYGTISIPSVVAIRDTIDNTIILPKENVVYEDSLYTAWVSGVSPSLDSIRIRQKIVTITTQVPYEVVRKRKFTFGVQVGIGPNYGLINKKWDVGPYVGIGIGYNF